MIALPETRRGRRSAAQQALYEEQLQAFVDAIMEIDSSLDFRPGSRGWCYLLEAYGLGKGDFDKAQSLITDCRKSGLLPLDIVSEDEDRKETCGEDLDDTAPFEEAKATIAYIQRAEQYYLPASAWEYQDVAIYMLVEKKDLRTLFAPVCERYGVKLVNGKGWSSLWARAKVLYFFSEWAAKGKRPVLLYCGDHDPAGLNISETLRKNLAELYPTVGAPHIPITIDRFGLNADFIEQHNLTWIDGLETGKGKRLESPSHPDHKKSYVQSYLREYGARKVEANALVARAQAGRQLCEAAILKYVDPDGYDRHAFFVDQQRVQMKAYLAEMVKQL